MSAAPEASIVITSYNYARFIPDAIESALGQAGVPVEVIVVDDGSTDATRTVLSRWSGRIRTLFQENRGQGAAMNAGFAASRAAVVLYLDSDDVLLPGAAGAALARFRDDPAVVQVRWPLWLVNAALERTGGILPPAIDRTADLRARTIDEGPIYDWNSVPPTSGNAWRRSFLERVLPMPEAPYRVAPDEYFFTLAPLYGLAATLDEPFACYREHGANSGFRRPPTSEKLAEDLGRLEASLEALATRLGEQGVVCDPGRWRSRNWNYLWMRRLVQAKQDLAELLPAGERFVLIDEGEWGDHLITAHCPLPFPERDRVWAGRPATGAEALAELARRQREGVRYLVVWWTVRWWLDAYPELGLYLREEARTVLDNDRLVVFELGGAGSAAIGVKTSA